MKYISAFSLFVLLAGCAGAPEKSLIPHTGYTDFRSALHLAGQTPASRTLVYIVALEGDAFGLVTYVGRRDGRFPGIMRASAGEIALPYQRISSEQADGMMMESGMIVLTNEEFQLATRTGMALELCGVGTCYSADVPSGLFMQALVE